MKMLTIKGLIDELENMKSEYGNIPVLMSSQYMENKALTLICGVYVMDVKDDENGEGQALMITDFVLKFD